MGLLVQGLSDGKRLIYAGMLALLYLTFLIIVEGPPSFPQWHL